MHYTFAPTVAKVTLGSKKQKRMDEEGEIVTVEVPHLVVQLTFTSDRAVKAAAEMSRFMAQEVVVNVEGEGRQ